jgi:uncharacterized membrane protein YeaQ/YmgE (transglycosylase-associated protein family)
MSTKQFTTIGALVGSTIGSFIPLLWGASELSFSSLLFGTIGAVAGIYIGYRMSQN